MMNLGNEKVDINCECGKTHKASFQDVINAKTIKCTCGRYIKLTDKDGSVKKSVTDVNKAFKDLENAFKRFGK